MKPTKPVCKHCGSDQILCDAYAKWDQQNQAWKVSSIQDDGDKYCEVCIDVTTIEWKEL